MIAFKCWRDRWVVASKSARPSSRFTMKQKTIRLFALISLMSASAFGADSFHYSVPPGFTALSKDASSTLSEGLPPEVMQRAREFDTYAVVVEEGIPVAEVAVKIDEASGTVLNSVENIAQLAAKAPEFRLFSKSEVELDGVPCGRIEFTVVVQGVTFQKLAYVLPFGKKRAWVVLTATPTDFPRFRSEFEESIAAASGLSPAHDPSVTAKQVAMLSLGALVGVALRKTFRGRAHRRGRRRTAA